VVATAGLAGTAASLDLTAPAQQLLLAPGAGLATRHAAPRLNKERLARYSAPADPVAMSCKWGSACLDRWLVLPMGALACPNNHPSVDASWHALNAAYVAALLDRPEEMDMAGRGRYLRGGEGVPPVEGRLPPKLSLNAAARAGVADAVVRSTPACDPRAVAGGWIPGADL